MCGNCQNKGRCREQFSRTDAKKMPKSAFQNKKKRHTRKTANARSPHHTSDAKIPEGAACCKGHVGYNFPTANSQENRRPLHNHGGYHNLGAQNVINTQTFGMGTWTPIKDAPLCIRKTYQTSPRPKVSTQQIHRSKKQHIVRKQWPCTSIQSSNPSHLACRTGAQWTPKSSIAETCTKQTKTTRVTTI